MQLQATPYGISKRLDELINNLAEMQEALDAGNDEVELDAQFVTPLSTLPLAVFANKTSMNITCTDDSDDDACSYLDTIAFQEGVTSFDKENKRYLPITNLSTCEGCELLGEYEERMLSAFGLQKNVLSHLTSELVNNVAEHSKVRDYWLLAQSYTVPRHTVEIVLADCGIGYKKSYENTKWETKTDKDAIINALEGKSSKTELDGRGFGIPSIVKLFVGALNGKIIILSGDSLIYYKKEKRIEKPLRSYWQGAVIGISFFPKDVDFYECIK